MPAKPISRRPFKLLAAAEARLQTAYDALLAAHATQSATRRMLAGLEQDLAGLQSQVAAIESRRNHRSLADGQKLAGLQAQREFAEQKIAETRAAASAQAAATATALTNAKSAIQQGNKNFLDALQSAAEMAQAHQDQADAATAKPKPNRK